MQCESLSLITVTYPHISIQMPDMAFKSYFFFFIQIQYFQLVFEAEAGYQEWSLKSSEKFAVYQDSEIKFC